MNLAGRLCSLIKEDPSINTFNNNKKIFYKYYYHYLGNNHHDVNNIEIYEYLLKNDIKDDYNMPLLRTFIFESFSKFEQDVTQDIYYNNPPSIIHVNSSPFNYRLLEEAYARLKKYDKDGKMLDYDTFMRDLTESMIVYLNKKFFTTDIEDIKYMINKIQNNAFINRIIESSSKHNYLNKSYVFQYISRFLFTREFLNLGSLEGDSFLNAFKNGKIHNREVIAKIIKYINLDHFDSVFEYGISSFLDILDKTFKDDNYTKHVLFNGLCERIKKEEDYYLLFSLLVNDERASEYISDEDKKIILRYVTNNYPVGMDDDEVMFLLNNNPHSVTLLNLKEELSTATWEDETKATIIHLGNNVKNDSNFDTETAIKVLNNVFEGKEDSPVNVFFAFKRIIKDYLNDESIKIYLDGDSGNVLGCAMHEDNVIKISAQGILKLMSCKDFHKHPKAIGYLATIFHEARHIIQHKSMERKDMPDYIYDLYKENLIRDLISNYYKDNYYNFTLEYDARLVSYFRTIDFLNKYFPELKECEKWLLDKALLETQKKDNSRIIFKLGNKVTVDEALEKLVAINPGLVEENPLLQREFTLNGIRKTNEVAKRI